MNSGSTPLCSPNATRLTVLRQIDLLCEDFEAAWSAGQPYRLDYGQNTVPESASVDLFAELLKIELAYRMAAGEQPTPEAYLVEHPQWAESIRQVFRVELQRLGTTIGAPLAARGRKGELSGVEQQMTQIYRVLALRGEGGLGRVLEASDDQLQRHVALKHLRPEVRIDLGAEARFLREARLTASLEHPGVVPVYGVGADEKGTPYYVMRLVRGETLGQKIASLHATKGVWRDGPWMLELRSLLGRFHAMCLTMDYAHSQGIVHRDLKPDNVLLGNYGETLVVDWGLARPVGRRDTLTSQSVPLTNTHLTRQGAVVGTPTFMSPEQAVGGAVAEPAADVYGLGATLSAILTGKPPIDATTADEALRKTRAGEITPPRDRDGRIPRPLDAICRKALSRDAAKRYSSAARLAADVERWLAGEPVEAWTEPVWDRARRWIQRHRALSAAVAAGAAIALLMGLFAHSWADKTGRRQRLDGVVNGLVAADLPAVPEFETLLAEFGPEATAALYQRLSTDDKTAARRNVQLALVRSDVRQLDPLKDVLLTASPTEFRELTRQLRSRSRELVPWLWNEFEKPDLKPSRRLRLAAALATYDPKSAEWPKRGDTLARMLCEEPETDYGTWSQAFRGVAPHLTPALERLFSDRQSSLQVAAAAWLSLLGADDPRLLTRLIVASPDQQQLLPLTRALQEHAGQGVALLKQAAADRRLQTPVEATENPRQARIEMHRRRARAAAALLALNEPQTVWPLLDEAGDPTFRDWVVELLPHSGIEPSLIAEWWSAERNPQRRRILLEMLSQFPIEAFPETERARWIDAVRQTLVNDPDAGMHALARWTLRQWRVAPGDAGSRLLSPVRQWYETRSGETFVVVRGPVEFQMGASQDEYGAQPSEGLHRRRIDRSFAIAAEEVTWQQALRYVPTLKDVAIAGAESSPVACGRMTLLDAARYCRKLSEAEGIPEDQMCFPPIEQIVAGQSLQLPADYLERTGYRIPTQAEWEYAARAGSTSTYFFGDDWALGSTFAWHAGNAMGIAQPVGLKRPNPLGLFDVAGNVAEWCVEQSEGKPNSNATTSGPVVVDTFLQQRIAPRRNYTVRGGRADSVPLEMRSSARGFFPAERFPGEVGFRPVRTLPAVPLPKKS